jgi:hypothetical protein
MKITKTLSVEKPNIFFCQVLREARTGTIKYKLVQPTKERSCVLNYNYNNPNSIPLKLELFKGTK